MNGTMKRFETSLALCLTAIAIATLTGCASAARQIRKELAGFSCSRADFDRIDSAITTHLNVDNFSSREREVVSLFEEMNRKLVDQCPAAVLARCSAGSTNARWNRDSLRGPIESFGVSASTAIEYRWQHDGQARVREPVVTYSVNMNGDRYRAGMQCYREATR